MSNDVDEAFHLRDAAVVAAPAVPEMAGGETGGSGADADRWSATDQRRMRAPGTHREAKLHGFAATSMQRSLVYTSSVSWTFVLLACVMCCLSLALCEHMYYGNAIGLAAALAALATSAAGAALIGAFKPVKPAADAHASFYLLEIAKWLMVGTAVLSLGILADAIMAVHCEHHHGGLTPLELLKQQRGAGQPHDDLADQSFCVKIRDASPCNDSVSWDYRTRWYVWTVHCTSLVSALITITMCVATVVGIVHFEHMAKQGPRQAMRPFRIYVLRARYRQMAKRERALYPNEVAPAESDEPVNLDDVDAMERRQAAGRGHHHMWHRRRSDERKTARSSERASSQEDDAQPHRQSRRKHRSGRPTSGRMYYGDTDEQSAGTGGTTNTTGFTSAVREPDELEPPTRSPSVAPQSRAGPPTVGPTARPSAAPYLNLGSATPSGVPQVGAGAPLQHQLGSIERIGSRAPTEEQQQ